MTPSPPQPERGPGPRTPPEPVLRRLQERVRAADERIWGWIEGVAVRRRRASEGRAQAAREKAAARTATPKTPTSRDEAASPGTPSSPDRPIRPSPHRRFPRLSRYAPSMRTLGIIVALVLITDAVLWQRCGLHGCPDVMRLRAYQPGGAPVLYDRRGRPWGELRPVDRAIVRLETLPWYVPAAFVAVEDKRFYQHHGVDWPRVLGAAWRDIRSGGYAEGFSTIPMQLARNVWSDRIPAQQKTLRRKMMEIRVAMEIERKFSKKEILELYLNNIYFGDGAYGVEAAARDYFHHGARSLTLPEAAILAALPRAPAIYDPRDHPERARARRDLVLSLMVSGGFLDAGRAAAARQAPLGVAEQPLRTTGQGIGRYFAELVRRQMEAQFGEDLYRTPMKIVTTLDADAQRAAEQELERQLERIEAGELGAFHGPAYHRQRVPGVAGTDYLQGAVVVLDAHTGDIIAWVGGRDFDDSRFDRALSARRQMGSSFKPFVYARAVAAGIPISQPLLDEPTTFMVGGRPWTPRDFGDRYRGTVSVREAIVNSLNVPTVRLARAVGVPSVIGFAHQAGIRAPIPNSPAAALGLAEVSPLEMAAAYTGFATLGTRAEPRIVRRVLAADGSVLWEATPPRRSAVVDPGVAYIVTDMLRDAVDHGTGGPVREAGFQGLAAGKTGTTSDAADAWFAGYTPDAVGVVWVGFDRRREIAHDATGGHAAAPVWGRMMRRIYARWPASTPWPQPDNVVSLATDPESGQTLQQGCSAQGDGELFLTSAVPLAVCPETEPMVLGRPIGGLGGFLSGIWHSITGRSLPAQIQVPVVSHTPRGPWDPTLGANRVIMQRADTTSNP